MSYFREACQLLRRGREENVIGTDLAQISRWKSCNANLYHNLMVTMHAQQAATLDKSPWLQKQQSWQLPQTRRYRQTRVPSPVPITQPDNTLSWMVELARYPVPDGSIGLIKGFEQYAEQDGQVLTLSAAWGNPFPIPDMVWHFRLSNYRTLRNPWINVSGPSAIVDYLPGTAYSDFSATPGLWFPAGSCSATNVHLPIPGGNVLRVVAIVQPSNDVVSLAAKLVGSNQLETNNDAQFVVRTSW